MTRATIRQVGGDQAAAMPPDNQPNSPPPLPQKPSATQQFTAAGGSEMKFCTDTRNNKYGVMTPEYHEQYRLSVMMGKNASNERAFGMAMITISVRQINGQPVPMPNSDGELQALMKRIGTPGHMAVGALMEGMLLGDDGNEGQGQDDAT